MDERLCPYCAEVIKSAAVKCRHCGSDVEPIPPKAEQALTPGKPVPGWAIFAGTLVAIGGAMFALMQSYGSPKPVSAEAARLNIEVAAQRAVRDRLKDPSSAQFGEFRYVRGKAGCGTVNARNALGGYAGAQRFIYLGKDVGVIFEHDFEPFKFATLWQESCP